MCVCVCVGEWLDTHRRLGAQSVPAAGRHDYVERRSMRVTAQVGSATTVEDSDFDTGRFLVKYRSVSRSIYYLSTYTVIPYLVPAFVVPRYFACIVSVSPWSGLFNRRPCDCMARGSRVPSECLPSASRSHADCTPIVRQSYVSRV